MITPALPFEKYVIGDLSWVNQSLKTYLIRMADTFGDEEHQNVLLMRPSRRFSLSKQLYCRSMAHIIRLRKTYGFSQIEEGNA